MEEPQQQEAEAAVEIMSPCLTSVMAWELLLEITRHMDTAGRSAWRLVSKAACRAVYDSTTALAPGSDSTDSTTALLPQLVANCSGLKQLKCSYLPRLDCVASLLQLPLGMEAIEVSCTDVRDLSFIPRCTSLRRLAAERVPGCAGPYSRQLAAVLQQLPGLTALQLGCNALDLDAARDAATALQDLTHLQELDVKGVGQKAAAALLPALPHLKALRVLDLSYCGLGAPALLHAILQLTRLQQLDLSANNLQAHGAASLAPALRQLQHLEDLDLHYNQLGDEGVSALAPAIQQLTRLTSIDLGQSNFGQAGAQTLTRSLRHLNRLQKLQLYNNDFGSAGAALLAPALHALPGLQVLELTETGLGAEGAAALAPALQRLTTLQRLELSGNALGPAGLQALLPGIHQLVTLRSLSLEDNDLDKDGTLLFAAGLSRLSALEEVDLEGAALDARFAPALDRIFRTSAPSCEVGQ